MSISGNIKENDQQEGIHDQRNRRIRRQILSLFSDDRLKGKISIPSFDLKEVKVYLLFFKEALIINFSDDFPESPPILRLENNQISFIFGQSDSLDTWNRNHKLTDVVAEIYFNVSHYVESQEMFLRSSQNMDGRSSEKIKQSSQQNLVKKKVMMNGCADNELTQTKNLNRHFRSKLRQVYTDLTKITDSSNIPQNAKWIEDSFTMPRVGFEDIARVLKNQWFNQEVFKQMENGKFMHKIMKGMMSIKSKKLMVKYYHVMLAAVRDPQNFVKWKYQ